MTRDVLRGGALRLASTAGAFVYQRIRPGVVLTAFRGRDTGEFGAAPLDVIGREYRLFEKPVEWFFDATLVENTARAVSEEWTTWLRQHRTELSQMHVLTSDPETHLRISVARHFSDALKQMALYKDRAKWERAFLLRSSGSAAVPAIHERFAEPAVTVTRTESREGLVCLSAPASQWTFRTLPGEILFTTFSGDDEGDLTENALNEMQSRVDSRQGKLHWFLDLRDARNVATQVSQTWTEWIATHHTRLARVTALSPSPLFPLVLTVAKYRSGADRLFHIHREVEPFRAELSAVASPEVAKAAGV